mgnify:CR=1 FL=1
MSDVKALFGLIDKKNKRRLIGAVICCVLSVLCGILPYLGVWGIVTCFLNCLLYTSPSPRDRG